MKNKIKYCIIFFVVASVLNALLTLGGGCATFCFFRTNCYNATYPYHLIGLFTIALGLSMYLLDAVKKSSIAFYIKFYLLWLEMSVLFSVFFWAYVGYSSMTDVIDRLLHNFFEMFIIANMVMLFSFPYNVCMLVLSFLLIRRYIKQT